MVADRQRLELMGSEPVSRVMKIFQKAEQARAQVMQSQRIARPR
jgi:hypothetical protein